MHIIYRGLDLSADVRAPVRLERLRIVCSFNSILVINLYIRQLSVSVRLASTCRLSLPGRQHVAASTQSCIDRRRRGVLSMHFHLHACVDPRRVPSRHNHYSFTHSLCLPSTALTCIVCTEASRALTASAKVWRSSGQ